MKNRKLTSAMRRVLAAKAEGTYVAVAEDGRTRHALKCRRLLNADETLTPRGRTLGERELRK